MTEREGSAWAANRRGDIDRRTLLATAASLAAGAAGATLGLPGRAMAQSEVFKLGWVRPTTGRLVSSFSMLYVGGLIAVDEINAAGGIMGRQIARQEEDDEASPAKEPAIVRKLVESGVNFVCGPTGSSQSLASLAAATPAKVIQASFANAADLGDGAKYPYHYQLLFNSNQQAEICVRHLVETLKLKKIGILQENTAFGEQATAASLVAFKKLGVEPVRIEVYSQTSPDLGPYIENLRKAGVEGLIGWMASLPSLAMAYNAMHKAKWYPHITGHNGVFYDAIYDLVPDEGLKNVTGTNYKSLMWTDSRPVGERQKAYAKKIMAIPEAKGNGCVIASAPFYDFLYLLKTVIEAEKTFDTEKIKRALDNVKGYDAMLGKITLSPQSHSGLSIDQISLGTVLSGKDPKSMGGVFREDAAK